MGERKAHRRELALLLGHSYKSSGQYDVTLTTHLRLQQTESAGGRSWRLERKPAVWTIHLSDYQVEGGGQLPPQLKVIATTDNTNFTVPHRKSEMIGLTKGAGAQGKSTMLNTIFGVQFSEKCGFRYFLIVDTEGLRAPELDALKRQRHDNELATFVIGLANLTIINIKADKKAMLGRFVIKDKLDAMTRKAAEQAGLVANLFCDVITFDYEKDVSFFPDLWTGRPPMAHEYSEWSRSFKKQMDEWEQKAQNILMSCLMENLPAEYQAKKAELPEFVNDEYKQLKGMMDKYFDESSEQETIAKWKDETESDLKYLKKKLERHAAETCDQLFNFRNNRARADSK
ncbi:Interferon-induced very large GTPase 1 [Geodia barretti]|uniref:Interferon-induced very large GTPase 1 n=1 Tax=Geodia barretti TaxID=519541 RepID=A0AA35SLY4_GEOBA|nr:Interferon-induced very large GTPase 1 [Geodia barretti]